MARYHQREIERWFEDIEQRTLDRCRAVQRRLKGDKAEGLTVLDQADANERVFAALATGDYEMLRRERFKPPWVSWIENQRPYTWLTTHEQVLVDLVPPDVDGNERMRRQSFEDKYHCTASQFVELLERKPNALRINVRNDAVSDYYDEAVIDSMGAILALSERFPESFYRLRPIRSIALPMLGVDFSACQRQADELCADYSAFAARLPSDDDALLETLTRSGRYPVPRQLAGRVAYYLAARTLWPGEQGAADEQLETWFGRAIESGGAIPFAFENLGELTQLLGRLTTTHHLFTAQLTGALGGTYGWKPREFDYASQIHDRQVPPRFDDGRQLSMASWFFALQAGMVTRPGEHDEVYPVLPSLRRPTDVEWRSFLDRVDGNRHKFRERMSKLNEIAGVSTIPRSDLDPDDSAEVERIVNRFDKVIRGGFDINKIAAAGLGIGAVAGKAAGMDLQDAFSVAGLCYAMAKAVPVLSSHCEKIERLTGGLCKQRAERTALSGALADFDLPYHAPR